MSFNVPLFLPAHYEILNLSLDCHLSSTLSLLIPFSHFFVLVVSLGLG